MSKIVSAGSASDTTPSEAPLNVIEIFDLIRTELEEVEDEFESQARSNIQVIANIGRYLRQAGGKRVRPALVLLSARVFGEVDYAVVRMATVIELLHTATLVHDDIIDGSELRRGRQPSRLSGAMIRQCSWETGCTCRPMRPPSNSAISIFSIR